MVYCRFGGRRWLLARALLALVSGELSSLRVGLVGGSDSAAAAPKPLRDRVHGGTADGATCLHDRPAAVSADWSTSADWEFHPNPLEMLEALEMDGVGDRDAAAAAGAGGAAPRLP